MTKHTSFSPSAIVTWSTDDLQKLRSLAQQGMSIDDISRLLKRSTSAIRNKAGMQGISLSKHTAARKSIAALEDETAA